MANVTTSYNNWDFNDQHVQQNLTGGDFVGSHTIILCASAPTLASTSQSSDGIGAIQGNPSGTISARIGTFSTTMSDSGSGDGFAIPLGVVSDIGLNQQRQINKIYEIGSKLSYTVSARTSISLNITRILYHGPNLLRMLYAYYPPELIENDVLRDVYKLGGGSEMAKIKLNGEFESRLPRIEDTAGLDNVFLNVASDLFSQPIGLVMYIKDNTKKDVAAIFIEDCNIVTHSFGVSQGSVVIAEGVQMTADRIRPLKVNVSSAIATRAQTATGDGIVA